MGCTEQDPGVNLPETGLGGSWELQDLVLCALEQHSPSLTPCGGKLQHKIQPVSQGCAQHAMGKAPACLSARAMPGVPTAPGSLRGSRVSQRVAAASKAQTEPGSHLPKLLGGRDFPWGRKVPRVRSAAGGEPRAVLAVRPGPAPAAAPCGSSSGSSADGGSAEAAAAPHEHSAAPAGWQSPSGPCQRHPALPT